MFDKKNKAMMMQSRRKSLSHIFIICVWMMRLAVRGGGMGREGVEMLKRISYQGYPSNDASFPLPQFVISLLIPLDVLFAAAVIVLRRIQFRRVIKCLWFIIQMVDRLDSRYVISANCEQFVWDCWSFECRSHSFHFNWISLEKCTWWIVHPYNSIIQGKYLSIIL